MTASGLQIIYTLDEVAIGPIFLWNVTDSLDSDLSQAETLIIIVWPFGKTEQLQKKKNYTNFFHTGPFWVKIVGILLRCTKRWHNSDYCLSPNSRLKSKSNEAVKLVEISGLYSSKLGFLHWICILYSRLRDLGTGWQVQYGNFGVEFLIHWNGYCSFGVIGWIGFIWRARWSIFWWVFILDQVESN